MTTYKYWIPLFGPNYSDSWIVRIICDNTRIEHWPTWHRRLWCVCCGSCCWGCCRCRGRCLRPSHGRCSVCTPEWRPASAPGPSPGKNESSNKISIQQCQRSATQVSMHNENESFISPGGVTWRWCWGRSMMVCRTSNNCVKSWSPDSQFTFMKRHSMWRVVPGNTISLPSFVWLIEPSYLIIYRQCTLET